MNSLIPRLMPILIQVPRPGSFGNCAEEMFFGLLRARREDKKVLFLYPYPLVSRHPICNKKLFRLQSPYQINNAFVFHIGLCIVTIMFIFMWLLPTIVRLRGVRKEVAFGRSGIWKPHYNNTFTWEDLNNQEWNQQYDEYDPPVLAEDDYRVCQEAMSQMKISSRDWFVCLHVRESGYRGDSSINRNSSIENYFKAIKAISDAGGWVVRIGDATMAPLPEMDRVVDYVHTGFKSEAMDLYLISQCLFFLGTN